MKAMLASIPLALYFAIAAYAAGPVDTVTVYKSPTCSCCNGWVEYMRENGFGVQTVDRENLVDIKKELGLTDGRLMSCHTAVVDGYVIEGHVPADDVRRLLSERPDVVGITAPGMPQLSPGMHSVKPENYDVLTFDSEGRIGTFSSY